MADGHPRKRRWCALVATDEEKVFLPAVDVYESGSDFLVLLDVPGADRDSIEVTATETELTVTASGPDAPQAERVVSESPDGWRRRRFAISGVDSEGIEAELKNGVLRLRLPKSAACAVRRIDVESEA